MRPERARLALGILLAIGVALPLAASEEPSDAQVVRMRLVDSTTLDLGFGSSQWLYPLDAPKETLEKGPKLVSAHPVWYEARYGDSEDSTFTLVIDESGGTGRGHDTLYVDGDNDDRIDPETERFSFRMSTTSSDHPLRIKLLVTAGGKTVPYHVSFAAFPYSDENHPEKKIHATLRNGPYYVGDAMLLGKPVKIAIADLDSNGLFNDVEMGLFDGDRLFVDMDNDGDFKDDASGYSHIGCPYGRYTKLGGRWHFVLASSDGGRVEIRKATPLLGTVEAAPMVASADLRSEHQPCFLEFADRKARGPAGTYSACSVTLKAQDEGGRTWETTGTFAKDGRPRVTITEGEPFGLSAGPPLRVEPKVTRKRGSSVMEVELAITGSAGETYRWQNNDPSSPRPGFVVLDGAGRAIHSATFEYG